MKWWAPEPMDPIEPQEVRDRFSRLVALLIVAATLASAVTVYLHGYASMRGDAAAVDAQTLGVQATGQRLFGQQVAQTNLDWFALADEQRARAGALAQSLGLIAPGVPLQPDLARDIERWRQIAARTEARSAIRRGGPFGPERDPAFPGRFLAGSILIAERFWALQDAANEENLAWKRKENAFAATLTLFAVAIYLLSLSLTLRTRVTRLLTGLAVLLLIFGALRAWSTIASRPSRAPDAAATAWAHGVVASRRARSPADHQAARRFFDWAIAVRPSFANAYAARARTIVDGGTPQTQGLISVMTAEALRDATPDYLRAWERGVRNKSVLLSLGFEFFLHAVSPPDVSVAAGLRRSGEAPTALLERSIAFTKDALKLDPTDPILHFNLGLALLAAHRVEDARRAYGAGVYTTLYDPVRGNAELRTSWTFKDRMVSGALTDLEILLAVGQRIRGTDREREILARQVAILKEYIVGSVSLGKVAAQDRNLSVSELKVVVFPTVLQWKANLPDYRPGKDVLYAQWYYLDPRGLGWAGLPNPSGLQDPELDRRTGEYFVDVDFTPGTAVPECLRPGRYRLELYANGHLAAVAEQSATEGLVGLRAAVFPDLNVALCRPVGWQRWRGSRLGVGGGFVSPDGTRGVLVFRYHHPRGSVPGDQNDRALTAAYLEHTIRRLTRLNTFWSIPAFSGQRQDRFFMDLSAGVKRESRYPGLPGEPGFPAGRIYAGAGLSRQEGAVIVGVVFGPPAFFEVDDPFDAYDLFDSFVLNEKVRMASSGP